HMTVLENANAGDFNDIVKCNILKSMIGEKYAPVSFQNNFVNPARDTIGNQQLAIQRLTQEKYQPYDTPDTYEARIRPLIIRVADNDVQVLGFLKSHLTVYQQSSYNTKIIEVPIPDTQKMIDEALAKQKSNYDAEIEKLRKEVQSSKAQKTQAPVPQTVEPVRQPRGPPSNLKTEEDYGKYYLSKFLNDLGIYSKEDLDLNYTEKPFQRTNQFTRMDRIESKVDEIGQMTSQFGKMLSPVMQKMCQSHTVQKEESDEWFSSLQYLNVSINDLSISESFLDPGSISKYSTESLGWFIDVPVSIKDKDGKTVTATGNFTRIDNGEPELMLCLNMTWI
ncbi:5128_t:CDS:2, partial [Diversispora eburnea]